jgi:hypothetical protein
MTSYFPPRESLVSDIPAGDGNIEKLFLRCTAGMSLTKVSMGGNHELSPPRETLVRDIPTGDGNIEKLFFTV